MGHFIELSKTIYSGRLHEVGANWSIDFDEGRIVPELENNTIDKLNLMNKERRKEYLSFNRLNANGIKQQNRLKNNLLGHFNVTDLDDIPIVKEYPEVFLNNKSTLFKRKMDVDLLYVYLYLKFGNKVDNFHCWNDREVRVFLIKHGFYKCDEYEIMDLLMADFQRLLNEYHLL